MYSEKVMDHFMNPRNVGEIENASGVGTVGNAKWGDIMRMYLDIDDNGIIQDVKFKTFGCGAAVATSSMATELVKGKTIQQALDKKLIKSGTIIVDSTHTNASVRAKSPTQILRDMSKQLRKEIYKSVYELSEKFPEKQSLEDGLEEEIIYTKNLLRALEKGIADCGNQ